MTTTRTGQRQPLEVQRVFNPYNEAMLDALRVVLDLPRKPVVVKEDENSDKGKVSTGRLAISP